MKVLSNDKSLTIIGLVILTSVLVLGIYQGQKASQASTGSLVKISLKVNIADAKEVKVSGSFNNWQQRCCLTRQENTDEWSIDLQLMPGVYEYVLLVDGKQWVPNNHGKQLNDGLGGTNGVLYVNKTAAKQGANDV